MPDALLTEQDVEEAYSEAYAHAIAAGAGYVVSKKNFDRDGVDICFEAGGHMRPKLDVQLKATINLPLGGSVLRYPCPIRNYDLLRIQTQTPRILIVLHLPPNKSDWLKISPEALCLKNCAYWLHLLGAQETDNTTSITVDIPAANRFDVDALKSLMEQSRSGRIG